MYKPPENFNRVKSIKSKFENLERNTENVCNNNKSVVNGHNLKIAVKPLTKSKTEIGLCNKSAPQNGSPTKLQVCDQSKRNIKRTPAFRLDKNSDRSSAFSRNSHLNKSHHFASNSIPVTNSALIKSCDSVNNLNQSKNAQCNNVQKTGQFVRPLLVKSKSSHDFAYIRNKFNNNECSTNQDNCDVRKTVGDIKTTEIQNGNECNKKTKQDLALLYTEPIPKALRNNHKVENHIYSNFNIKSDTQKLKASNTEIHNTSTLKITDKTDKKPPTINKLNPELTDTLKSALKRPLPPGPAPKKPPRTFLHSPVSTNRDNTSFSNLAKTMEKKLHLSAVKAAKTKEKKKSDPMLMLTKLENALRNNKLGKRQVKHDISTSGEDSDDSLLFKSKTNASRTESRTLPITPNTDNDFKNNSNNSILSQAFPCLNGIACSNSAYAKIAEPTSCFFVSAKKDEPLYAEPFHFGKDSNGVDSGVDVVDGRNSFGKVKRNSLYYLSSPLLNTNCVESTKSNMDTEKHIDFSKTLIDSTPLDYNKQMSSENSSLSSFTSDSAISTPTEETKSFENQNGKIKTIIDCLSNNETKIEKDKKIAFDPVNLNNQHRVETLKYALKNTLDRVFNDSSLNNTMQDLNLDSNDFTMVNHDKTLIEEQIVNRFKTYVKKTPKYANCLLKADKLFYCLIIVQRSCYSQIMFKYPSCAVIPDKIEDLCFPETDSGPLDQNAQCYTLVITNEKGERTYGYCRRVKPEGSSSCLPLVYCILSNHRAARFYNNVLHELESRHGLPDDQREQLVKCFYYNKFPKPGHWVTIKLSYDSNCSQNETNSALCERLNNCTVGGKNGQYGSLKKTSQQCAEITLKLHPDIRYEDPDLTELHELSTDILRKIFSSLLLERKVVLISCLMGKLSSCVEALQTILYPFSWPHTFIPILPESLWGIVESPTPIICGVLSNKVVNKYLIEDGIVVDLDEGSVLVEMGDENSILTSAMVKIWKKGLSNAKNVPIPNNEHSVSLSDAYLQVFAFCLKNIGDCIVDGVFQKEKFIKSSPRCIRRFLKWFTDTTMFFAFINSVTEKSEDFSILYKHIT